MLLAVKPLLQVSNEGISSRKWILCFLLIRDVSSLSTTEVLANRPQLGNNFHSPLRERER